MKVIILAGGLGTRLTEETIVKPKPMVEIGGFPIIWHIMKIYSKYGIKEFIPTLGYKGEIIKDYFINYQNARTNLSVNVETGEINRYDNHDENWIIHLLDTIFEFLIFFRMRIFSMSSFVNSFDFKLKKPKSLII